MHLKSAADEFDGLRDRRRVAVAGTKFELAVKTGFTKSHRDLHYLLHACPSPCSEEPCYVRALKAPYISQIKSKQFV